ncbi:SMI1/KNR4 family protein [Vibrio nigripulchritudo]|uniref:SMI1/KNR4 family protein n=1 Tax=Vibrio nigripulchritudo TaxID=28173 RepID=UPI0003B1B7D0|nr:SMI1/KNR4 family protein [Vibrio nigripulchritudo]CCN72827.1 hypothetical protein VIBNISFn118_660079 [Vibrio nigripulchritudo SFn118]
MIIQYDEKHEHLDYDVESKKFKEITGYQIPNEYLSFLKLNGTGLYPNPGLYDDLMEVGVFYSLCMNELGEEHNIFYENSILYSNGRLTRNVLAFAETLDSHNYFCIILDGKLKGKVALLGDDSFLLFDGYNASVLDEKEDLLEHGFLDFLARLA